MEAKDQNNCVETSSDYQLTVNTIFHPENIAGLAKKKASISLPKL